mmetsp:Transcript_2465/g.9724  ORF Transcript_2465/g.9724 Transcript_2465/m.9724 type:complete len:246 (-) Transcript_2465:996-1733(-)
MSGPHCRPRARGRLSGPHGPGFGSSAAHLHARQPGHEAPHAARRRLRSGRRPAGGGRPPRRPVAGRRPHGVDSRPGHAHARAPPPSLRRQAAAGGPSERADDAPGRKARAGHGGGAAPGRAAAGRPRGQLRRGRRRRRRWRRRRRAWQGRRRGGLRQRRRGSRGVRDPGVPPQPVAGLGMGRLGDGPEARRRGGRRGRRGGLRQRARRLRGRPAEREGRYGGGCGGDLGCGGGGGVARKGRRRRR